MMDVVRTVDDRCSTTISVAVPVDVNVEVLVSAFVIVRIASVVVVEAEYPKNAEQNIEAAGPSSRADKF